MELHVSLTAAVPNGAWVEYIPQLDAITTSRHGDATTATRFRPTSPGSASTGTSRRSSGAAVARATIGA